MPSDYSCALVIQDYFSKFIWIKPCKDVSAYNVCTILEDHFCNHGVCRIITTDRAAAFTSELTQRLASRARVRMIRSTAYHAASHGAVEKANQFLIDHLRCELNGSIQDWQLYGYNQRTLKRESPSR